MSKAREVYPGVTVNPKVQFGKPCIQGYGISTAAVAARFKAGENIAGIAFDYGLQDYRIEDALRWECLSRRQQLRRIEKATDGERRTEEEDRND